MSPLSDQCETPAGTGKTITALDTHRIGDFSPKIVGSFPVPSDSRCNGHSCTHLCPTGDTVSEIDGTCVAPGSRCEPTGAAADPRAPMPFRASGRDAHARVATRHPRARPSSSSDNPLSEDERSRTPAPDRSERALSRGAGPSRTQLGEPKFRSHPKRPAGPVDHPQCVTQESRWHTEREASGSPPRVR